MKFLDSKEQVLELQLTQHGKRLLSQGTFKPIYYGFYDDDVLYDSLYGSFSESQDACEGRIQEDSPRLSVQTNYSSAERFLRRSPVTDTTSWWDNFYGNNKKPTGKLGGTSLAPIKYIKQEPDKNEALRCSLGTSSPLSEKIPAWSVAFLTGELSGSTSYYTDTENELHFIPQVDTKIKYNVKIKLAPLGGLQITPFGDPSESPSDIPETVYQDRTYVDVEDDLLLIHLKEDNVTFSKENYDLEVYEVLNDGAELFPLSFLGDKTSWDEFSMLDGAPVGSNTDVAYYVDVSVDDEINPDILISAVSEKLGNMYLDKELRRMQNRLEVDNTRRDIYKSVVDTTEHCEE
tara:strand:- start:1144 stop:2184 length:1041 start_codon:yes stop_codon:yes gene_type:complete